MSEDHDDTSVPQETDDTLETTSEDTKTDTQDTEDVSITSPTPDEIPMESDVEDKSDSAGASSKSHDKKKPLIVLVAILLIAGGVALWWFTQHHGSQSNQSSSPQTTAPAAAEEQLPVDEALQKFITPTTGETWLKEPVKLPDQHFLKDYGDGSTADYYEVGARDGKKIIRSDTFTTQVLVRLYEVSTDKKVTLIAHPDSQAVYPVDTSDPNLENIVTVDTTTHYDSLSIPKSLDLGNGYTATRVENTDNNGKSTGDVRPDLGQLPYDNTSTDGLTVTTVKTLGQSTVQREEKAYVDTHLTGISYTVRLPIGTEVNLEYMPVPLDASGYQWTTGATSVEDTFKAITRGCSTRYGSVSRYDAAQAADLEQVGTTSDNQAVYQPKDPTNGLLAKAYDEYKYFYGTQSSISKNEFVRRHGLILVKDKADQWLVYVQSKLAPAGGCAKPVIYLYPQSTRAVNVQVGADVKVSDPLYPAATGWQNVIAQPNGQLTYQGKSYGSLFWEGPGVGPYPAITSGTVVKRQDAIATIRQQLAQQGLNVQESTDFIAYWQDKLPNKPYVRLTWFNTAQMNRLAPLAVTPKPDTVIRVFLDFAGLDEPINLPTQHLAAIPRYGFTVIEWGGLSPVKLY